MRWVLVVLMFAGCNLAPEPVYSVRRSALVPHPQPPMRTGHTMDHEVRITGYDSTYLVPIKPVEAAGANAGLYVARHNMGGSVDVRITEHTDIAVIGQASLARGSMPVATDAAKPPDSQAAGGFGAELAHAIPMSDHAQIALVAGAMVFGVPYYEEGHCIANCTGVGDYSQSGDTSIAIWSLSVLPSYREGRFTAFGGITWRNHPTNVKTDTETQAALAYDNTGELNGGPTYTILGAGLEWAATDTVKLLVEVHQPLTDTVVRYGPALGFAASFDFDVPKSRVYPP
jgi:hypothetical protein